MNKDARIYVAGDRGLVGSALVRRLRADGFTNLIVRKRNELDLTDAAAVGRFFDEARPEFVFLAAAKVGGIWANNTFPADFIHDNLAIALNVISAAHRAGTQKLLFLGSSCVYPKHAPQPMREEHLLTGPLEPTNQPYAIAKIAGIELCASYRRQFNNDFVSVMPTNLYGPHDSFDPVNSHVIPALLRRFHEARINNANEVVIWGTGAPLREFLHVDDLADACVFVMDRYSDATPINIGSGEEISIKELATLIADVVEYRGRINFDPSKPDGTPRKLLDTSRLNMLGWHPRIRLEAGLRATYEWYQTAQV